MLNAAIKDAMRESVLCWLATVSSTGQPNVSPEEMFVPYGDDGVLIAHIASPKSVANIKENAAVCVSFVEVFKQKGFKLAGVALVEEAQLVEQSAPDFNVFLKELHVLGGEGFPVQSIIKIKVEEAHPIIAPSYRLFPETTEQTTTEQTTTEQTQITQAMNSYGVCLK